jgi:hypothetical protein
MMHFNPSIPKWTVRWAMRCRAALAAFGPSLLRVSALRAPAAIAKAAPFVAVFALSWFAAALVSGAGQL